MAETDREGFLRGDPPAGSGLGPLVVQSAAGGGGTTEITNDVGNPIPVSKNTTVNSAANPFVVDGSAVTQPVIQTAYSYSHQATSATTVVKSGVGVLHSIVINTRGTSSTATIYDNTAGSGTVIAIIDTTLSTTSFVYDLNFATGLTVVTAGATPADITVTYR